MKVLQLVKVELKQGNKNRYRYEVVENGTVLVTRHSNQEYVACFVEETKNTMGASIKYTYGCPFFFGRLELIGKNASGKLVEPYAVALLRLEDFTRIPHYNPIIRMNNVLANNSITIMGIDPKDFSL